MHVAAALTLAGARALFRLGPDGSFTPRDPADAATRWKSFARMWAVRTQPPAAPIRLTTGQLVWPTGVRFPDGFEARDAEGTVARVNYRRVAITSAAAVGEGS